MNWKKPTRAMTVPILMLLCAIGVSTAGKMPYHPSIDAANFLTTIDNPYYPLTPGTTYKYTERSGKHVAEDEVTVTHDTRVIMGVTCVVVHDVAREGGVVKEETYDWYAQDKQGNVWYFGEDTKEFHAGGKISTEGSWEAGVGPNQPGIIMPGKAAPGDAYRQEYGPGHAEDMGQIMAVKESVKVPYGAFKDCVRTKEWSLLEAGTDKKWYAKGVGCVKELSAHGDVTELISLTKDNHE